MGKILIIVFIIFLSVSGIIYGEEQTDNMISLNTIINQTGAVLRWEPYRSYGELTLYGQSVIFKPDIPFLLVNYSEKSKNVLVKRGPRGGVFFSSNAADLISDIFVPKLVSTNSMRIKAVIIDPGHGGKDPGAIGTYMDGENQVQLLEKDIVLSVAIEIADKLKKTYLDKEIILTRSTDDFITLEQRTLIANEISLQENESIIFVSVHANASFNSKAKGFEVWYLPPEYRRELLDVSAVDSDLSDVVPILNTMLEEEITVESILLAQSIQKGLSHTVGNLIEDRGLKEESWFVVRNAKMPAVLVELGFITNQEEAMILGDKRHLKKISEGIYNGISGFIDHFETQYSSGD